MQKKWQVSNTVVSSANPKDIWRRWTSVEAWPEEDSNLGSAQLEGEFAVGSKIIMKPKRSPKSTVTIVEVTNNKSFTTEGKIPFGKLTISHNVKSLENSKASFTHTITLTGPMRKLFVKLFAQKLADNLPQKMKNIAKLAESA
jgi:hypothetical protein